MTEHTLAEQLTTNLSVDDDAGLVSDHHGVFAFTDQDTLLEEINSARQFVESCQFTTDEDRKALNKAKALSNKVVAARKKMLKQAQSEVFSRASEQVDDVTSACGELVDAIKARADHFERAYRHEKNAMISDQVNERLRYKPQYQDHIAVADMMSSRWMNRTVTDKQVIAELDQRFAAVDALVATTGSVSEAVDLLKASQWDTAGAITAFHDKRADDIERDDTDDDDTADGDSDVVTVTVSIPRDQYQKLVAGVKKLGGSIR